MFYNLLNTLSTSTGFDVTLHFEYTHDSSNVVNTDVIITGQNTGKVYLGNTNSLGNVSFTNVSEELNLINVGDNDISTLYIGKDLLKAYQIAKESNIKYGQLYNGYVAQSGNIAPSGWHVPTEAEIDTLLANYSDSNDAYTALIEGGSSGFEAKMSGYRDYTFDSFRNITSTAMLAMSDSNSILYFVSGSNGCYKISENISIGKSIRLIRDIETGWNEGDIVTDLDGNIYNTVKIGNQVWTVQNWACTQYNDGTLIPNVRLNDDWTGLGSGAYCAYNNNSQNVFIDYQESNILYGRLYNWYAVDNAAELAPAGLKVPTDAELTTLEDWLTANGYSGSEGSALAGRADLWQDGALDSDPNFGATGFNMLPGGQRFNDGGFLDIENRAFLWSATENHISEYAEHWRLFYYSSSVAFYSYYKELGFSVRMLVTDTDTYSAGDKYTDLDGNVYDIIQIGTQLWLAQNWACTKYADGSTIPEITDNTNWSNDTTGARCSYNNSESEYVFK